jgi:FkbM family methyltransferase
MVREVFSDRIYEQGGIALSDGATIIDAGANVGIFAISILERFSGLRLLCFEPVPLVRECLEENLRTWAEDGANDLSVLPRALGDRNGEIEIAFLPHSPGNSTMFPDQKVLELASVAAEIGQGNFPKAWVEAHAAQVEQVDGSAEPRDLMGDRQMLPCRLSDLSSIIEEFGLDRIDLLKIDVEGAEFLLLDGLAERHWPLLRQIAMECSVWNKHRVPELSDSLRDRGFSVTIAGLGSAENAIADGFPCMVYAWR